MAYYSLSLNIVVEAESETEAFSRVRTNFCVVDDPNGSITGDTVSFLVEDEVTEVDEEDVDEEEVA